MTKKPDDVQYRDMIVTFADLLGFSAMVDGTTTANEIKAILDLLKVQSEVEDDLGQLLDLQTIRISDCVIRGIGIKRNVNQPLVQQELLSLVHIQSELIYRGIVMRGGVAIGDCYMEPGQVFGPAYQRAFAIEKDEAKHPRVVIDDLIITAFKEYPGLLGGHTAEEAWEQLSSLVRQDPEDGRWFLDYLHAFETECDEPSDYYQKFIVRHRQLVLDRLAEHKGNERVLPKYRWLGRYHNAITHTFPNDLLEKCGLSRQNVDITPAVVAEPT